MHGPVHAKDDEPGENEHYGPVDRGQGILSEKAIGGHDRPGEHGADSDYERSEEPATCSGQVLGERCYEEAGHACDERHQRERLQGRRHSVRCDERACYQPCGTGEDRVAHERYCWAAPLPPQVPARKNGGKDGDVEQNGRDGGPLGQDPALGDLRRDCAENNSQRDPGDDHEQVQPARFGPLGLVFARHFGREEAVAIGRHGVSNVSAKLVGGAKSGNRTFILYQKSVKKSMCGLL